MEIRYATVEDFDLLVQNDRHVQKDVLQDCLEQSRILIASEGGQFLGWLRYNLFWDIVPFMNMLHFEEDQRGKGYGTQLVMFWENEMKRIGHEKVMTSSQQDEYAQHFYVKRGYRAIGGFMLEGDPLEIVFEKRFQ